MIFHITTEEQWLEAKLLGEYKHPSLQNEGFIHCSTRDQVVTSANRYFMDYAFVFVLQIEEEKLTSQLIYEPSTGGELFPHVYGSINVDAIVKIVKEKRGDDGFFYLTNTL